MLKDEIEKLMKTDPLAEAEKLTGESYKDSDLTTSIGMMKHFEKSKQMEALMDMTYDTSYSCTIARHLEISEKLGFRVVLKEEKDWKYGRESFYVQYKPGFLMCCDTFRGTDRNSANLFYNIRGTDRKSLLRVIYTGQTHDDGLLLAGHHDVREGLRHTVCKLESTGTVLPVWKYNVYLHLNPYWDFDEVKETYGEDYIRRNTAIDAMSQERVSLLPDEVHEMIAVCFKQKAGQ